MTVRLFFAMDGAASGEESSDGEEWSPTANDVPADVPEITRERRVSTEVVERARLYVNEAGPEFHLGSVEAEMLALQRTAADLDAWGSRLQECGDEEVFLKGHELAQLCFMIASIRNDFERHKFLVKDQLGSLSASTADITLELGNQKSEAEIRYSRILCNEGEILKLENHMKHIEDGWVKREDLQTDAARVTARMNELKERLDRNAELHVASNQTLQSELHALKSWTREQKVATSHHDDVLGELKNRCLHTHSILRREGNRVDNAADLALRAKSKIEETKVQSQRGEQSLRKDLEQMAKAFAALRERIDDMQAQIVESEGQPKSKSGTEARERITRQELEEHISNSESMFEALHRIDKCERSEFELKNVLFSLQQRLDDSCPNTVTIPELSKRIEDIVCRFTQFQRHITDEVFHVKHDETTHVVRAFQQRWSPHHMWFSLREIVGTWVKFVDQRKRTRNALKVTKQLYSKHHASPRIRSWWYAAQQDLHEGNLSRAEELSHSLGAKVEECRAIVQKRERASVEFSRDFNGRIGRLERKIETQWEQKADQSMVVEMVDRVERRLDRDVDPERIKRAETEFRDDIRELQAHLSKAGDVTRCTERVAAMDETLRCTLKRFDEDLRARATVQDIATKADAEVVERAMVTLAKQSDQVACLVATDLERFRCALVRLLELSPDVQRTALSLGVIASSETGGQCISSGQEARKAPPLPDPGGQGLLGGLMGIDGQRYRQCPDSAHAAEEQVQRIMSENLRFPTMLRASIAATGAAQPSLPVSYVTTTLAAKTPAGGQCTTFDREPGWLADGRSANLFASSKGYDRPLSTRAFFPSSSRAHEERSPDTICAAVSEEPLPAVESHQGGGGGVRKRPQSSARPRSGVAGQRALSSARPQISSRGLPSAVVHAGS